MQRPAGRKSVKETRGDSVAAVQGGRHRTGTTRLKGQVEMDVHSMETK